VEEREGGKWGGSGDGSRFGGVRVEVVGEVIVVGLRRIRREQRTMSLISYDSEER
jgi:hypothetical protein